MDFWEALILGVVEGLTEYLPVSSTGHLLVTQRLLGIVQDDAANAYAIAIQAGAILAVLGLYRGRVRQMLGGLAGRDEVGRRLALCLGVAFLPAAGLGLALEDWLEEHLFGPWPIVAAWIVGGGVILAFRNGRSRREGAAPLERITYRAALVVGLFQCLALWPGTSRSLVTILGAIVVGLSLSAAVEFSFLLGLLTLGAATAYKALQHGTTMVEAYGLVAVLVGFLAAWASAVLAVRWMVAWLQRHGLGLFGYWRLAAGVAVGGLLLAEVL